MGKPSVAKAAPKEKPKATPSTEAPANSIHEKIRDSACALEDILGRLSGVRAGLNALQMEQIEDKEGWFFLICMEGLDKYIDKLLSLERDLYALSVRTSPAAPAGGAQ
jgi:hypothetical protein